jgi:hypothetical protein
MTGMTGLSAIENRRGGVADDHRSPNDGGGSTSRTGDHERTEIAGRAPTDTKFKLSLNVVFPLLGDRATWSHEHLLPIFVSLIVALMLAAVPFPWLQLTMCGKPAPPGVNEAWQVFSILGIYIAFIINYYINQMCGRARSGLLQALVSVSTFWLLQAVSRITGTTSSTL